MRAAGDPPTGRQDKCGLSWQITPRALTASLADPDPEGAAAGRAFEAMMRMGKIEIAAIEAGRRA